MVTIRAGFDGSGSTFARRRFTWTSRVLVSPDVVGAPHPVDQGLAGEDPAGVGQEELEQLELLERQLHALAADDHLVALGVERHVADAERLAARGRGRHRLGAPAAQHGAHAGHQLAEPVGLGDVVVGAHLEADDGVDLAALGRDHDDRHRRPAPELAAHVDARDLGEHHVEQHEVGLHGVEHVERLGPVAGDLHAEALPLEPDGEGLDEGVLVLDDQDRGAGGGHRDQPASEVTATGPGSDRESQGERGALALEGLDPDLAGVVAGDVADDGEPEAGAAGLAAAGPVDPVEALEDALEVAARGCRCRGRRRTRSIQRPSVRARTRTDGTRVAVLHRVLEQVVGGRDELAPVAEHDQPGAAARRRRW